MQTSFPDPVTTRGLHFDPKPTYPWSRKRNASWAVAVLCTFAAQGPLRANGVMTNLTDLSIEQLVNIEVATVYSASRHEQKVTDAPSSVSIVTADEIKRFGYRTLDDVLRSVRGVYVSNDRNYSYIGMRGFLRPGDYNSRVLLLIDGHRLNDNIYDSIYTGTEAVLDLNLIERVEVSRGPSSSIYGNNAFFGVINIVTKPGAAVSGLEAGASAASYNTYSGILTFGKKFKNDLEVLLSGSLYDSAGHGRLHYPEFQSINNGIAEDRDEDSAHRFFAKFSYHDFTLSGAFVSRTKSVPTASFSSLFNGPEETTDIRGYVDLKFEREVVPDLTVLARVAYDQYSYYGDYPFDYPPVTLNKDDTLGQWVSTEVQLTKRLLDRHTLIAGVDYRENVRQFQQNYDSSPRALYFRSDHTSRNIGVYGQAEVALLTNLVLNAGVRYDHFSTFGDSVNPRAGLIYHPTTQSTLKFLYGRAFRAPNDYELFYDSAGFEINPDLAAETIDTYELVYEQYFLKYYRLSLSGFLYNIQDLISQSTRTNSSGGTLIFFDNVDEVNARGLELEMEAKYPGGVLIRGSYALQRAEDGDGRELSNSPRHLGKFNLSVPVYRDKIFTSLELQYHGSVRTLARRKADDFLVANFTLFGRELLPGLEVSAGVYNLFDTKYGYPGAADHVQDVIRQDGRTFFAKLTYKF
jgi:outer membrane receptor for ferrienterochelin and colicins